MAQFKEEFRLSRYINLDEYDKYMKDRPLEQRISLNFILDKIQKNKNLKVIEFGAGTGRFTKLLLNLCPRIDLTLVEPDKNCCLRLKELKRKYKQIKIIQTPAEDYKSKDKFDFIVMATVFHHIPFKNKSKLLKITKNLLKKEGMFLCGDVFLAEYKTAKERTKVLKKSVEKWIQEARKSGNRKELKMARKMKEIVFRKDYGGEYFICPSKFELLIKKANLKIKGKINVTNTNPFDMENYFYLIMK